VPDEPPEGDVIEMDELCVRVSPALWLWGAMSRSVGSVLAFVVADRTDGALERLLREEMPLGWRDADAAPTRPVCTDFLGAYARLLPAGSHEACDKGSGKTSRVEALNTLWRQRQSGLARKSCGVSRRITQDLTERFLLLADWHNRRCLEKWEKAQRGNQTATPSDP
jgi:IS1 family transposase